MGGNSSIDRAGFVFLCAVTPGPRCTWSPRDSSDQPLHTDYCSTSVRTSMEEVRIRHDPLPIIATSASHGALEVNLSYEELALKDGCSLMLKRHLG
jgi:hypothetical protein